MLAAARKEARTRFESGKEMDAQSPETLKAIDEALNVGKFLRRNIVQGMKDENAQAYRMP